MFLCTFHPDDFDALVDLTIRAFEPLQHGIRDQLGDELFARQNGQWQQDYRTTLTELTSPQCRHRVLVADPHGAPAGYAVWAAHPGSSGAQGEITLLAVDPLHQHAGLGRRLIDATCQEMRAASCVVTWVSTGGDETHAPARAVYPTAGFVPLPTVFCSRLLQGMPANGRAAVAHAGNGGSVPERAGCHPPRGSRSWRDAIGRQQ